MRTTKIIPLLSTVLFFLVSPAATHSAVTSYQYDNLYRLSQVQRADGTIIAYQYDEAGNRIRKVVTVQLAVPQGDINADRNVDLMDVVSGLQVIAGNTPAGVTVQGDVDGNSRIGVAEVLFALHAVSGEGVVTVVQPGPVDGKDTYYGTYYGTNGEPDFQQMFYGGWGDAYYDYVQFDIAALPAADKVATAKIHLYSDITTVNDPQIDVRYITANWTEPGITKSNNPSSTLYKRMDRVVAGWNVIDITTLYKDWKEGRLPNYGIKLSPNYTNQSNGAFYTSDYLADPAKRPKLVVETVE